MIVHFSAHISKWELVCKFGVIFHIFIITCLCSRFHAWNQWFFYSVITFSYTKCFVYSYTVDVVFALSYQTLRELHQVPAAGHSGSVPFEKDGPAVLWFDTQGLYPSGPIHVSVNHRRHWPQPRSEDGRPEIPEYTTTTSSQRRHPQAAAIYQPIQVIRSQRGCWKTVEGARQRISPLPDLSLQQVPGDWWSPY